MGKFGLTIDGKHTTEYGLKMLSMYIPQPAVKTNLISVPGAGESNDGNCHADPRPESKSNPG